jgi:hypothetical protein
VSLAAQNVGQHAQGVGKIQESVLVVRPVQLNDDPAGEDKPVDRAPVLEISANATDLTCEEIKGLQRTGEHGQSVLDTARRRGSLSFSVSRMDIAAVKVSHLPFPAGCSSPRSGCLFQVPSW